MLNILRILRVVHPLQGFVYESARFFDGAESGIIEVKVRERKGSKGRCPLTGQRCSGYDRRPMRAWEFVPWWGMKVMLLYAPRRVSCPDGKVRQEALPWVRNKGQLCAVFQLYLAQWARKLSWQDVARHFRVGWHQVANSVRWVVDYGLAHRSLEGITALGMDEVHLGSKSGFWCVIYQIDKGMRRLLYVAPGKCTKAISEGLEHLGPQALASVRFVCTDLGRAFIKSVRRHLSHAVHVLDRFHIRNLLSDSIEQTRRAEAKRLRRTTGEPVLKGSRFALLKNRRNWTSNQRGLMGKLLGLNIRSVKAFLLVESFEHFWTYSSWSWARKFLLAWTAQVRRCRIPALKRSAATLLLYQHEILNYFVAKKEISSASVEALNNRIKLTLRKSCGFRSPELTRIALYHSLGALPEPLISTHTFF